ncbi:type VII secretion protein EccCa [Mycolicibacterium sp. 120270]|uniref:type VII secretion protein EccCa n=1 Tax=Mycolicibacterium sp. 120270 TaxID=3090600 RepID=UPI00299DF840|nr:type VII secretion protein EccCa [Mycolicibacterium sp. 120270]MDX1884500.1 type VII secretion protein EccCa [Mycolicibacterium sp. 120270]
MTPACVYYPMEFLIQERLAAPQMARGEIAVQSPPDVPKESPASPLARILPAAMILATAAMMALYFTSESSATRNPMFMFFPVLMLVSALGTFATGGRGGSRSTEIEQDRRDYLRYLVSLDTQVAETAAQQHLSMAWDSPDPACLWTMVGSRRMWERRSDHADFGYARVGRGPRGLSTPLVVPDPGPPEKCDPVTSAGLRRLIRHRAEVPDLPVTLPITRHRVISIDGDAHACRNLLRALICHLAVMHSPHDLRIAAAVDPLTASEWDWLKWLPHHDHPFALDDAGRARLTFSSLSGAEAALAGCEAIAAVLVIDANIVAEARPIPSDSDHVTWVEVGTRCERNADLQLIARDGCLLRRTEDGEDVIGRADAMTAGHAVALARRLSRYRPTSAAAEHISSSTSWPQLMGMGAGGRLDPTVMWRTARAREQMLRVPIGISEDGAPVDLDIKEAAAGGMGPHGLCIGATGSGKSEFLRTLTLGMITAHSPELLNLILIDFKGGATFLGFERAPHVAAVITNLADEAHLVARMKDALAGEVNRRQELLRAAGGFANTADYNAARSKGADPLPALFIVVDEFSELLSHHPDFIDLFIAIGRLGRSLGIHLLLASQRVDEGRLRGLESHLSYRVCLKTFSAAESRSVLGIPDAYHLPNTPGAAYLKTGAGDPVRFQTAFVSGPYAARSGDTAAAQRTCVPRLYTAAPMGRVVSGHPGEAFVNTTGTVVEAVLGGVQGRGAPAHQVWLPPLAESPALDALLHRVGGRAPLTVPIGLVDCPFDQRREFLMAEFAGGNGNGAVVGGPRSGKSATLQTLILGLAETHDPRDVQFYCLDFGGGALSSLSTLPHVGVVAGRSDVELVRRTVGQLELLLRAREARRADDAYGDVFLIVDGWAVFRQEFDLESAITALAAQGLSYGIHVVLSASRWAEIRPALKDSIGTRIELRLGDPAESEMDRKRARQLLGSPPGRGITRDGREFVIATGRLDAGTADRLRARYPGRAAPRIEVLPTHVDYDVLIAQSPVGRPGTQAYLGVGEAELISIAVDFAAEGHLVVLGQGECGKTGVLRTLCTEIVRCNTADTAALFIVDYRRTLLGVVESEHLAGYIPSAAALTSQLTALVQRLQARIPGADVSQQQLRTRSWWSGPEIYVVIDDYDLVAPGSGANPLTPLVDFLPYAKDLGLHIVVARRSGGAARAMFDPVLARLRDLGCMGLMMSASPDEGVLFGTVRPSQLPPGRGTLVTRSQPEQLVQIAWTEPV